MTHKPYALFDLDGTLVDSMTYWRHAPAVLAERLLGGLDGERRRKSIDTVYYGDQARLFASWGLTLSKREIITACEDIMAEHYRRDVSPKAGTLAYLNRLRAQGVRMGIVTLTRHREAEICLDKTGLAPYFSFVLTPEDTEDGSGKEAPGIFALALGKLGCRDARDCAFYDDSLYALKTASALGFYTCAVKDAWAEGEREEVLSLCDAYLSLDEK